MQLSFSRIFVLLTFTAFFFGCSSTPKISQTRVSDQDAKSWFHQYCSNGNHAMSGDLVIKSNTREFQGQFPASIRFESSGAFMLEVTSIIGGTLMRLSSYGQSMQTEVPSKPKYNRSGITHYLGLDVPILTQLLMGDLPCPKEVKGTAIKVEGNQMLMVTPNWKWSFEKSEASAGGVPVRITLLPRDATDAKLKVELLIEDWDRENRFAKKVSVKGPEGDLRWTWRRRE